MGLFNRKQTDEAKATEEKKVATDKTDVAKKAVKTAVKKETSVKTSTKTTEKKVALVKKGNAYRTLIKPLVTEKAANMGAESKYVFEVSVDANKIEVAKAVEEVYGEKPVSVNIMNYGGKKVVRGRFVGHRKDWRKAIVTLAKGKSINIYEGI